MGDPELRNQPPPPRAEWPVIWRWMPTRLYGAIIWRRTFVFAALFPAFLVVTAWLIAMGVTDRWWIFTNDDPEYWPIAPVMTAGSFIAGASSEGGASVAFPIMTLVLDVKPAVARDFGLLIQSIGMTAASFLILYLKIEIEPRAIPPALLGGMGGVLLAFEYLEENLTPKYVKIIFVSVWFTYVIALLLLNRRTFLGKPRRIFLRLVSPNWWKYLILGVAGFGGGILSGLTGSGVDLASFSVLTLLFNVSEKTATPTSVIQMALISIFGACYKAVRGTIADEAVNYFLCACPIVVFGAPLGAYCISFCHRLVHCITVVTLDTAQFVTALIVVDMDTGLWITVAVTVVIGGILWAIVAYLGVRFLSFQRAKGHLVHKESPDGSLEQSVSGISKPDSDNIDTQQRDEL